MLKLGGISPKGKIQATPLVVVVTIAWPILLLAAANYTTFTTTEVRTRQTQSRHNFRTHGHLSTSMQHRDIQRADNLLRLGGVAQVATNANTQRKIMYTYWERYFYILLSLFNNSSLDDCQRPKSVSFAIGICTHFREFAEICSWDTVRRSWNVNELLDTQFS